MEGPVAAGEWSLEAGVLLGALVLDLAFRELPKALHPVAWMESLASWIEQKTLPGTGPVKAFLTGLGLAVLAPLGFAGLAWLAIAGLRDLGPLPYLVGGAVLLKTTFTVMVRRDRRLTESPNAGWTISAMSGLLGVALAIPRSSLPRPSGNTPPPAAWGAHLPSS